MTPERWRLTKQLLVQALQVKPVDRPEFLARVCAADVSLRQDVERLLAEDVSSNFLEPADAESDDLGLTGCTVSGYRVLRRLGAGGMGVVYEAEDLRLHRRVALKFPPQRVAGDIIALRRFEREARSASALNHPNICTVYGVEEHDRQPVIVMELLEGESLKDRIRRGPTPICEILNWAMQALDGLGTAHAKGLIHRDVKPGNIFITTGGRVKILDFGLAKTIHGDGSERDASEESLTAESVIPGTTAYMSPEQISGEELDCRSDLFSLGVVLYEAATGERPFAGRNGVLLMDSILHAQPVPPSRVNHSLPASFDTIIARLLTKDRARRYRQASDICADLKRLKDEIESGLPATRAGRHDVQSKRGRVGRAMPVAAAALVVAIAAALHYRYGSQALTQKDTIVLADFTNATGEVVFDDTLKQALAVHLEQSPFLNVLSDEKVNATLQMMGRRPGERLTIEVARDVCQRTGSKALLTGSIAGLGRQYVVGLRAIDCSSGDSVAQAQVQAAGKEQVLKAVGEAANTVRGKLGESSLSLRKHDTPLEQATTASLEALRAYSAGWKAQLHGDTEAIPFFKHAIELDPGFAVAYSQLAMPYANIGEMTRASEALRKAFSLRDRVSEYEKYRISGYYYSLVTGELDKSNEIFELWRQEYPRDLIPNVEITCNYSSVGQWEKALIEARRALRIDAQNVFVYVNLATVYFALNRLAEAKATLDQAQIRKIDAYSLRQERYYAAFLGNDYDSMNRLTSGPGSEEDTLLAAQSDTEAYFGRLAKARALAQRAADTARAGGARETAALWLANGALHDAEAGLPKPAGQLARAALALAPGLGVRALAALAMARAGQVAEARRIADTLARDSPVDTILQNYWLPAIHAAGELAGNHGAQAVESLRPATAYELGQSQPFIFGMMYPPYLRGQAYLLMRKGSEAMVEFRKLTEHPGIQLNWPLGSLVHLGLGRAYALEGETAKARSAYRKFLELWKDADPEAAVLRQAKAESAKLE
ncbi:MAG TPA: protein kinase [Bryobacteraceae bacterium]|nr:protein kinase [Bryobacteraceae bacterium]